MLSRVQRRNSRRALSPWTRSNELLSFLSATNVLKQGYIYDADGIRVRQVVADSDVALDCANHSFARSIHVWIWWYHIYIVLKSIPILSTGKNPK